MEKAEVELLYHEGVGSLFQYKKSLFLDAFNNPSIVIPKIVTFVKKAGDYFLAIFKTLTTWFILKSIYTSVGLEHFILLALSVFIAQQYLTSHKNKEENKE